jgi:murein tripeptide amidase MpaA
MRILFAAGFAACLAAQVKHVPPVSQFETPAMREARSIVESTAAAPAEFRTRAESSGYTHTGDYAEAVALYRKLAALPHARLLSMGRSGEGREMFVLVVSKDGAFTPAAAARTGKPVVLLQNGIHAGENGGKDASIMLLRDVLATRRHAAWLDKVILLSIVVFNPDGHERVSPYNRINENGPAEMGFRVTARRLNLNRDYIKADSPEMRAWLKLYTAWLPDLLIDNHVTDGGDSQWDVTIATHSQGDIAAPVGRWVEGLYLPQMLGAMERDGHLPGWYLGFGGRGGGALAAAGYSPRYSTGYAAAQNRAALLVETHSLKPFRTRVWSHYDIMRHSIEAVASNPEALRKASREADALMATTTPGSKMFLEGRPGTASEPYVLRQLVSERHESRAAGAPVTRYTAQPNDTPARLIRVLEPRLEIPAPAGYIVPPAYAEVIERLGWHGIAATPLKAEQTAEVSGYRFEKVQFAAAPFEGRFLVSGFGSRPFTQRQRIPAGSVYVPVAQRAARLVMHLLEPEAPDSLVRWGFFHGIFEQKEYFSDFVFAPIADRMLEEDPALRAAFEAQLEKDKAFAANPRARLAWLFERSPYFEPDKDLYPVLRLATPVAP